MYFKREIAIGDVHGMFEMLYDLVENKIKFNPKEDLLIFLGDYIDRGHKSKHVINYLSELHEKYPKNIILLEGNHEDMAYLTLMGHDAAHDVWMNNGGVQTLAAFGADLNNLEPFKEIFLPFYERLQTWYESDKFYFVHGCLPLGVNSPEETDKDTMLWGREFEYNGPKEVVVGHSIQREVVRYGKTICVDTGSMWYGKLSAYDTLNDKVYKSYGVDIEDKRRLRDE